MVRDWPGPREMNPWLFPHIDGWKGQEKYYFASSIASLGAERRSSEQYDDAWQVS